MPYVLVTADFPGVSTEQRNKIYDCLAKKHWVKVTEFGRDISTTWYVYYADDNEQSNLRSAIANFGECAQPYCKPKLVLHCGPGKPALHGLT